MFWAVRLSTTWARTTLMNAWTASRRTVASELFSCSRAARTAVWAILTPFLVRMPTKSGCSIVRLTPLGLFAAIQSLKLWERPV